MTRTSLTRSALLSVYLLLSCTGINAQQLLSASISSGIQNFDLNWSIAGSSAGSNPNVYSELIWRKINGWSNGGNLSFENNKHFILEGSAFITTILSGHVTDTDYQHDDRRDIAFYGLFDSDKGLAYNFELKAGWKIAVRPGLTIKLFTGYFSSGQHLYLTDNTGNYDQNLNSTYFTGWQGWLLSTNITINKNHFEFIPSCTYYQSSYSGKGNWNLIPEFEHPVSYTHKATGFGIAPSLSVNYAMTSHIKLEVTGKNEWWKTGKGIDKLYQVSGSRPVTLLNVVTLKSYAVQLGIKADL